MVTVRGSVESVESRLVSGVLRCGVCGEPLAPWGHARRRVIAMAAGGEGFHPRRSRCRGCGRTHVLLPAELWSRRRYGAAVITTVLLLGARAAAAGGVTARPWLRGPGGVRRQVPPSTARSWRSRFTERANALREQLVRLLPLVDVAGRHLVPAGSPGGDCLAAVEAVTAGLACRFPQLATIRSHEVAAHLSAGLWLAPAVPILGFNTSLFSVAANTPS